ncbi:hypothetical protein BH09DEP1_BH09DEP1_3440 [soil metagenome]
MKYILKLIVVILLIKNVILISMDKPLGTFKSEKEYDAEVQKIQATLELQKDIDELEVPEEKISTRALYRDNPKRLQASKEYEADLLKEIQDLLARGADINVTNDEGKTILAAAIYHGYSNIVEYLLSRGAQIDLLPKGWPPLIDAAYWDYQDIVEWLLAAGADVNQRAENNGVTALIMATDAGHIDMVELLLARGADENIKDDEGESALDHAKEDPEMMKLLALERVK